MSQKRYLTCKEFAVRKYSARRYLLGAFDHLVEMKVNSAFNEIDKYDDWIATSAQQSTDSATVFLAKRTVGHAVKQLKVDKGALGDVS